MGVTHAGTGAFRAAGRQPQEPSQDSDRHDSSDWSLQADYFGSAAHAPQPVTLGLEGGALQIMGRDFVEHPTAAQVRIGHRSSSGRMLLTLPDGAMLDCPTDARLEQWLAQPQAIARPKGRRRRQAALALIAMLMAWLALPATAERLVDRVPAQIDRHIGREMLSRLDQGWLQPSQLPTTRQQDLRMRLEKQAAGHCPAVASSPWEAQFRARGQLGAPSAFGLPGGTIVITDDRLGPTGEAAPALLDTLCRELQQVQHRQGLRTLARQAPTSLLLGLVFEDFSATVAVAWPVLSRWLPLERSR
ncbi:MAG: hypothetical protein RL654_1062 [Pseudomonadota bacterium]|jgi:hypothetical protein